MKKKKNHIMWHIVVQAFILLSMCVSSCHVAPPEPPKIPPHSDDLLYQSRNWRQSDGLVSAREKLATALATLDASNGNLEVRVKKTSRNRAFTYPNSIATLSKAQRRRTGVYLILGLRQETGESARVMRQLAEKLRDDGWDAKVVPLAQWGSSQNQALSIDQFLRKNHHKVDRIVMVGFSMGASSWTHWIIDYSKQWSPKLLKKFQLGVFFAGSFRGSALAHWVNEGKGVKASLFRMKLSKMDDESSCVFTAIDSAATDLWADKKRPPLNTMLPGFTLVQYVTLPDGSNGRPAHEPKFRKIAKIVNHAMPWIGPFDGVLESASQVLPPTDTTPQWIVRILSAHCITEGSYYTGGKVSIDHGHVQGKRVEAVKDMVDDLLRALPAKLLK